MGLYYYGARWYALGRFIQADTLIANPGNPVAWDRYAYCLENPIRYVDPSGYFTEDEINAYLKDKYGDNWEVYRNTWKKDMLFWEMLLKADYYDHLNSITYNLGTCVFIKNEKTGSFGFENDKDRNDNLWQYQGYGPYALNGEQQYPSQIADKINENNKVVDKFRNQCQPGDEINPGDLVVVQPIYDYTDEGPIPTRKQNVITYKIGYNFDPLGGTGLPFFFTGNVSLGMTIVNLILGYTFF